VAGSPRRLACIDVGTNTALLLIVEATPDGVRVLDDRSRIVRLGEGLDRSPRLNPDAVIRTLAALSDYGNLARDAGATVKAVGTAALRRAEDGAEFLARAAELLGCELEVISGEREAALSLAAVMGSFPELRQGRVVVTDIGGGSTEVILVEDGRLTGAVSYDVGSVRLTERYIRSDPPTAQELAALDSELASVFAPVAATAAGTTVVGVAGTLTTLLAVRDEVDPYDPAKVHGRHLSSAEIEVLIQRMAAMPLATRRELPGLEPLRADVIVAGAAILRTLLQRLGQTQVLVSDRGVRWGLCYESLG
jgi:exopolyphosphatase / guanosine-5'-triphosphate,3'-diphosphate pyrophosphatase